MRVSFLPPERRCTHDTQRPYDQQRGTSRLESHHHRSYVTRLFSDSSLQGIVCSPTEVLTNPEGCFARQRGYLHIPLLGSKTSRNNTTDTEAYQTRVRASVRSTTENRWYTCALDTHAAEVCARVLLPVRHETVGQPDLMTSNGVRAGSRSTTTIDHTVYFQTRRSNS